MADVYDKQHQQLREMNLNKTVNPPRTSEPLPAYLMEKPLNAKTPNNTNVVPTPEPVKLTAKQKKKQEKKAARLAEEALQIAQQQRKESLDETCSVTTTSTATSKAQQPPPKGKLSKKEAKKEAKKAKGNTETKVDEIVQMTRDISLNEQQRSKPNPKVKTADETPKKEKRRVKVTKFEYADPQYAKNKFDVLNMDDDDFASESDDDNFRESVSPSWPARSSTSDSTKYSKDSSFTTVQKTRAEKAKAQKLASQAWNREAKAALAAKAATVQSTPFNLRPQSPYVRVPPPPQPIEIQLTKKQLKKMAQQQTRLAAQQAARTPVNPKPAPSINPSQSMAQTLKNSMQKLSLNDDTTIELVREKQKAALVGGPHNPSVSIIDQLSRGIQMEGLTLPPGITLTRVDPVQAEQNRVKKESIGRVSLVLI